MKVTEEDIREQYFEEIGEDYLDDIEAYKQWL